MHAESQEVVAANHNDEKVEPIVHILPPLKFDTKTVILSSNFILAVSNLSYSRQQEARFPLKSNVYWKKYFNEQLKKIFVILRHLLKCQIWPISLH